MDNDDKHQASSSVDNDKLSINTFAEKYLKKFYRIQVFKNVVIGLAFTFFLGQAIFSIFDDKYPGEHLAVININGPIASGNPEGDGLRLSKSLSKAFKSDSAKAILLVANSPGGSPAQAEMVFETIKALKIKHPKPVIVSVTDMCASACYFIVAAGDVIYAHGSSIIGSIGVRVDSWDLEETVGRIGAKRRTLTTGPYKAILDPFKEMNESDEEIIRKNALSPMFQVFTDAILSGRGDKIAAADKPVLFSGLFWTGQQAKNLGLIDEIKVTPLVIADLFEDYQVNEVKRYNVGRVNISQFFTAALQDVVTSVSNEVKTVGKELTFD